MAFAGLNYFAVLLAGVAGFIFGSLWYGLLAKPWMKAALITEAEMTGPDGKRKMPLVPVLFGFLANLMMAFTMAGILGHMVVDVQHGLILAGFIVAGFVFPALLVNYAFQGRPFHLTLIDTGHWAGVLAIAGVIIGYLGV